MSDHRVWWSDEWNSLIAYAPREGISPESWPKMLTLAHDAELPDDARELRLPSDDLTPCQSCGLFPDGSKS